MIKDGEYGFSVKFDVESQIKGDGGINLDGAAVGIRWISFANNNFIEGFNSANEAAKGWVRYYAAYSIKENTEVSSLIYERNGKYFYTPGMEWLKTSKFPRATSSPSPKILFQRNSDILKDVNVVGFIHSHGAYKRPTDEKFSTWEAGYPTDADYDIYGAYPSQKRGIAESYPNLILYLSTPSGNLYRRNREDSPDSYSGRQFIIGSGFYKDPKIK